MIRALLFTLFLILLGCRATEYSDDDSGADDDAGDDDADDDDTTPDTGITDCEPEDFNLNNCLEIEFQEFDMSFCNPIDEELTFSIDSEAEWEELVTTQCDQISTPPEQPDWLETMIVGVASRASGCGGFSGSVWFLECGNPDQRAYAYVHAREGECEGEIPLATAVLVPRSVRPTHFFNCSYVF